MLELLHKILHNFVLEKLHFSTVVQEDNLSKRVYSQRCPFNINVYKYNLLPF